MQIPVTREPTTPRFTFTGRFASFIRTYSKRGVFKLAYLLSKALQAFFKLLYHIMAAATLPANAGGVFGYGGMGDTGGGGGGGFGGGGTPPGPNDHYNDDHDPEYCLDVGGEDEEGSEGTSDEEAEESDDGAPLPIKTVPGARPTTGGKGPWVPPHLRSFIGKKGPAAPRVETKPATPEKVEQPKTSKTDDGKPQTSKIDDGEPKTKKKKAPKDKLGYSFIDDPKNKYIPRQVFPKVKGGNQQSSGEFQCPDYTCSSNYKKGGLVRAEPLKRHWKTPSFKVSSQISELSGSTEDQVLTLYSILRTTRLDG